MSMSDYVNDFNKLNEQLMETFREQQRFPPDNETVNIGGITATRDKHTAIELILDFLGPDVAEWFEMIR